VILVRVLGAVAIGLFGLAAFTPAVALLARWSIPQGRAEHAQAIVVLGTGGVAPGGGLTPSSLRATMEGIKLFREGQAPTLVLSGDAAPDRPTEPEARAEVARRSGVPAAAIVVAAPARTTHEEAVQAEALLRPRGIRRILLVVDGPGAARALAVFSRAGFEAVPAPWGDPITLDAPPGERLSLLRFLAMEAIARLYYRLMGYV
jgi:uncharacterized SAM-binding protein YcdF (DUF218 family)